MVKYSQLEMQNNIPRNETSFIFDFYQGIKFCQNIFGDEQLKKRRLNGKMKESKAI